jgi:hypothetical protein
MSYPITAHTVRKISRVAHRVSLRSGVLAGEKKQHE